MKQAASACLIALLAVNGGCSRHASAEPVTGTLSNGVRVVVVPFAKSTNVSIFTFVPMGLCADDAQRAQWSHLVEHLVIRSTFPNDLQRANAETLPDHMRLDFYGHAGDWREGLSHHKRWLEGVPFTAATLEAEKPKVISECDFTAKNFATHKFAAAAWWQAWRHGRKHVALKGDVLGAALPEVQQYRDARLFVADHTTLCAVGGVDPKVFIAEAAKAIGGLKPQAPPPRRNEPWPVNGGTMDVTWDLEARHLLLAWPLPAFDDPDYAALMAAAQWLSMRFFSDSRLKQQAGPVIAAADLITPVGNFFYVSAPLRPGASFEEIEPILRAQIEALAKSGTANKPMSQQLAMSLTQVADPALLAAQAGAAMPLKMIEANIGLAFAMNIHRYRDAREALARRLRDLSTDHLRQAAAKRLGTNSLTVRITGPAKSGPP